MSNNCYYCVVMLVINYNLLGLDDVFSILMFRSNFVREV